MNKILFYDPDITGHHCEYLKHPARYISKQQNYQGVIVCNKVAGETLASEYEASGSILKIDCIDARAQQAIDDANSLWRRGKADAECFASSIEKHRPDLAIMLHANPLQPFLNGRSFRKCEARIRGILFDPFPLAERLERQEDSFKVRLTRFRKNCQVRWFARNKNIEKMFVLNDRKISNHMNVITGHSGRFEAIPDPLPLHLEDSVAASVVPNRGAVQLLFIGSINRRKGLLETMNAIEALPLQYKDKVSLRVVGRFSDPSLRDEAVAQCSRLVEAGYLIELSEGWVSDGQFSAEMQKCDMVLAPYVGFHGSSGVIGHAAHFRKPLLATCDGLVGELVKGRKIGEVVQTRNPELYSATLLQYLERPWDYSSNQEKYAEEMSSISFMKQLVS